LLTRSQLHNTGTLALVNAGLGGAGTITNDGTITVTGICHITGATPLLHSQDGRLDLGDGATLVIGADTLLQLGGGTLTGPGVLRVGDGAGGELDIVADTAVPNLWIGPNSTVAPQDGASLPSPDLPGTLTVTSHLDWGVDASATQSSALLGHVVVAAKATATVASVATLNNGRLENAGHLTITDDATLRAEGVAPILVNLGALTLSDTGAISGGRSRTPAWSRRPEAAPPPWTAR
jgi:hypothetical protein